MSPILTFFIGAAILMLLLFYNGTTQHNLRRKLGTVLIVVTTIFAVLSIRNMGIKRGIDLLGGSEFVVQLKPGEDAEGQPKPVSSESVQQAIGILEKRLNPDGQKDLLLAPQG
jgi:SecD/SecF fusion protein